MRQRVRRLKSIHAYSSRRLREQTAPYRTARAIQRDAGRLARSGDNRHPGRGFYGKLCKRLGATNGFLPAEQTHDGRLSWMLPILL